MRRMVHTLGRSALLLAVTLGLAACQREADAPAADTAAPAFKDDAEKAAYSLGFLFSDNVRRQFGDDINVDAFLRGARDQLSGAEALVDDTEAQRVLGALMEQRQAAADAEASSNLDSGLKYLEENGKREGVVALPSGLQYAVSYTHLTLPTKA